MPTESQHWTPSRGDQLDLDRLGRALMSVFVTSAVKSGHTSVRGTLDYLQPDSPEVEFVKDLLASAAGGPHALSNTKLAEKWFNSMDALRSRHQDARVVLAAQRSAEEPGNDLLPGNVKAGSPRKGGARPLTGGS